MRRRLAQLWDWLEGLVYAAQGWFQKRHVDPHDRDVEEREDPGGA